MAGASVPGVRAGTRPSRPGTASSPPPSPGGWCAAPTPARGSRRAGSRAGRTPCPKSPATAAAPSATARAASVSTITVRARHRSTHAPARSENNRTGACPTARRAPSWPAPASSARTAKSGRTMSVVCSPSWEAVWPAQSLRKSASRHREGRDAEEGDGTETPGVGRNEDRRPVREGAPGPGRDEGLAVPRPQGQHAMTGRSRPRTSTRARTTGHASPLPSWVTRRPNASARRLGATGDFGRGSPSGWRPSRQFLASR